jgi:glycerophosphoryl diester phosphodiesterase
MFMKITPIPFLAFFFSTLFCFSQAHNPFAPYTLIAHRGGVVEVDAPENSMAALQRAIDRGYYMVEIDMRLTKDSVLITQHDSHFRKYFGIDRLVSDMTWEEIQSLKDQSGYRVLLLEEVLAFCYGKIQVMLDNKIAGMDEKLFTEVVNLLKKYNLDKEALMIGSSASTAFFTGKIKLSCTRSQLEANQNREDYNPDHYYLFARDLSKADVDWANEQGIMVVAALNSFTFPEESLMEAARHKTNELKENGVTCFQIDGIFEDFFRE